MTLSRRHLLASAPLLLLSRIARADERVPLSEARLEELVREVARARQGVRTLSGPFTQIRKLGLMKAQIQSQGRIILVLPDRLRWELLPPDEVVYWVTPEGLSYRSRSGQGSVRGGNARALAAGLEDLRAMLGGDLGQLRRRYELRAFASPGGRDEIEFESTPKPGQDVRGMKAIHFGIAKDRVRPTFARLFEQNGDHSEIRFGELRPNVPVDPALMRP